MKWTTSHKDFKLIIGIVNRAVALKITNDRECTEMDITACHLNGCALKLGELFKADGFNFSHDVIGISNNINRANGKLKNFFLPRFSK